MVRGRHYSEVARITSRICGICSVGPHAGLGQGHRGRARHRGQRAELEAARAAQARRELRLARAARQLPGRARPARRAVGLPARRDARRGGGARPAPEEAGARVGLAHRRTHHASDERRPRRHGGRCPPPRSSRQLRERLLRRRARARGHGRDGRGAGAQRAGLRPADRVHRPVQRQGLRALRRRHPVGAPRRHEAALPGGRLQAGDQRVRRAAVDGQVHEEQAGLATRPARWRASTTTTTGSIPRRRRWRRRSASSRSAPTPT